MAQETTYINSVSSSAVTGHIPALDGVRGIAILLVLLFHFAQFGHRLPPPTVWIDKLFLKVSQVGWIGVDLFFVLSGFLITGILYDSKDGERYFRNFYARRCLRIFPLYYFSLVLFLVIFPRLFPANAALQAMKGDAFWYWTYLSNLWIAHKGFQWFGVIEHFWSLAIEEQFYFAWPLVVLLFRRQTLLRLCLALISVAFFVRVGLWLTGHTTAIYVLTVARIDALAVGAFLALAARGPNGLSRLASWAWPCASLTGTTLVLTFVWKRGWLSSDVIVATVGFTVLAVFFGSILVVALGSPRRGFLGKVFASAGLTFFGRYSYALYVVHYPLLFFVPGSLEFSRVPKVLGSQLPAHLLYMTMAILVSVILALLSWNLCEKQFLKLKIFFPYEANQSMTGRPLART